ncbi:Translation factor GUF1-like protein, mitochondrial [Hypsibius exemplaris]|uniref:Translation factor GUF1 homolog, mitochondrial n=1 Tax=Hypsibius exemplaris TaxID=2072580 RepID=A0A9X6NE30_HYPEX|nr:Translation factor GUF1-like protein, mitochondrial [Hypsibius exemplaris]
MHCGRFRRFGELGVGIKQLANRLSSRRIHGRLSSAHNSSLAHPKSLRPRVIFNSIRSVCCSRVVFAVDYSRDPDGPKLPDLQDFPPELIRNFCIVAHVDHGKSTLADRILEITGTIKPGSHDNQVLDRLEVERERGITVKAQTASLFYELDGKTYLLNLIDTPGHVDFNYEVARSLAACQGVVLLVDANQGVQAQTLATFYSAFEADKTIIPALNKIDLKHANPDAVAAQMKKALDIEPSEVLRISAKLGTGVPDLLRAIVHRIPPPVGNVNKPFRGLVFDSWFDKRRGVVTLVAVVDGQLKKEDKISFVSSDKVYEVKDIGLMRPDKVSAEKLYAGQVGYIMCGMKTTKEAQIGDTVSHKSSPVPPILPIRPAKQMHPEEKSKAKPAASDVVAAYIRQRRHPAWTSFFLSRRHVTNSHFGLSHFNFNVDGHNYHVLRTGCFPFLKYHCTKRPYEDLSWDNRLMRFLKILNLGLPMLAYGLAASFLIKHEERVFAGVYPEDQSQNESLRGSLDKLMLNDSSVSVTMEQSAALGQGWRLGFLGLLHMEVFLQRLEYEHGATCIATIPSVPYRAKFKFEKQIKEFRTEVLTVVNPQSIPEASVVSEFSEPWVMGTILTPSEYMGEILAICMERRAQQKNATFLDNTRVLMQFHMPLSEVIVDFFDILKSKTSGYASFDYEDAGYRPCTLVKQFPVAIQATVGGKIIAREDLKQLRKDVVAQKIYSHGGRDKGRAQKLLNRQKEGKARMRMVETFRYHTTVLLKF